MARWATYRGYPCLRMADISDDPGLPLAVFRDSRKHPSPLHTHDFWEIVVVMGGEGDHLTEGGQYRIRAGDAFVLRPHWIHGYRIRGRLSLINVLFDEPMLDAPMADLKTMPGYHALFTLEPLYRLEHGFETRLRLKRGQLDRVARLIDRLEEELRSGKPGALPMAVSWFLQVIVYLSRCYQQARVPRVQTYLKVGRAISYIERHYAEPITLAHLAEIANVSVNTLIREFKGATGHTPIDYLLRTRMRRAQRHLRNTRRTISQVAFDVGFNDSNYFSRQFRRILGVSPRDYRRTVT